MLLYKAQNINSCTIYNARHELIFKKTVNHLIKSSLLKGYISIIIDRIQLFNII